MRKNLYFYRIKFSITNLPDQEDFLDIKEFDSDYLLHSEVYAMEEFQRIRQLIEQGVLIKNVQDSAYVRAAFQVSLYLVRRNHQKEQEFFLKSLNNKNTAHTELENLVLDREYEELKIEYQNGLLRHLTPIYERYLFRIKIIETRSCVKREIQRRDIRIMGKNNRGYETFDEALKDARFIQGRELENRCDYDPEDGDHLQVQLFLVEKKKDDDEEYLLIDNNKEYPLEEPIKKELSEKSYMEYYILRRMEDNITFGIKPFLWTKNRFSNFQSNVESGISLTEYSDRYYQLLPDYVRVWDSIDYYYMVFEGKEWMNPDKRKIFLHHDLQKIRAAAIDFFDDVFLNHTSDIDSQLNIPKIGLILMKKKDNDPLYIRTTDPSKDQFLVPGMREEKELLNSLGYSFIDEDDSPHY